MLYSNPIKPPAHIAAAHAAGLWRFSFDSPNELHKIAEHAPGAAVYVRLRVDDSASVFPLSRKFGAEPDDACDLMLLARRLGLRPYGVTFHVGSQCGNPIAWRQAIADVGRLMRGCAAEGIEIEMLDLGGGFPARYVGGVPSHRRDRAPGHRRRWTSCCRTGPRCSPPSRAGTWSPRAAVMAASVIGRERRGGENWLYLDVGAYNGHDGDPADGERLALPAVDVAARPRRLPQLPFTVTGPSCDSSDTMFYGVPLPATIDVGDRLYIGSAGAYTLSYASAFNGFPPADPPVRRRTGRPGCTASTGP